jgi:hypothetical protein
MECVGPIIVAIVVIAQVITQAKKAQLDRQRRAMQQGAPLPPPRPVVARRPEPEYEEPEEYEEEIEDTPSPWAEERVPDFVPARDLPRPEAPPPEEPFRRRTAPLVPRQTTMPQTVAIPDLVRKHRVVRLDRKRLKNAILMSEILAPPLALRRDW